MMDSKLQKEIYDYIDKYGFKGYLGSSFIVSVELSNEDGPSIDHHDNDMRFTPSLPFDISEEDQVEVIGQYIYDLTGMRIDLDKIDELSHVSGRPFILPINEHTEQSYYVAFKKIPGTLIVRGRYNLKTLGDIEEIEGDLGFSESEIEDLGKLSIVRGSLWTAQDARHFTSLQNLNPLVEVSGDCNIKMTRMTSLGTLRKVGGNLNLRNTFLDSLGDLEYVGGNVLVSRHFDLDLSKVEVVGKIKRYKDIEEINF